MYLYQCPVNNSSPQIFTDITASISCNSCVCRINSMSIKALNNNIFCRLWTQLNYSKLSESLFRNLWASVSQLHVNDSDNLVIRGSIFHSRLRNVSLQIMSEICIYYWPRSLLSLCVLSQHSFRNIMHETGSYSEVINRMFALILLLREARDNRQTILPGFWYWLQTVEKAQSVNTLRC